MNLISSCSGLALSCEILKQELKVMHCRDNQGDLKETGSVVTGRGSLWSLRRNLDEEEIRGYKLHVEVAKFELKEEYDAMKKRKKRQDYKKKLPLQQKQLDWRPEKSWAILFVHERVVIIKNLFYPIDFEDNPLVLNEIREDL
ncbi:HIV Tat-specific factor 1-like [Sorex araneus]|uniref:HIV Tat-specific factor 1-like n=1 Tax=Sorex araneus TaxID=42254 RepID=UPI00243336D1|nr:HIV Tat-specific factor 1-like [Sorex araneus]